MKTQSIAKLLISAATLIIITILGDSLRHQAAAQGGINLRLPFNGTRRLTAYVDHRSPTYGNDTYSNIVVYTGEDRSPCVDCGQAWTTQGPYCYNVTIDQHDQNDEWVPLVGAFEFRGDGLDNVYLNNATTESDGSTEVCFDTIKFRQFRVFLPVILNNYSQ